MKKYLGFIQFVCLAGGAYAFVTQNWTFVAVFWSAVFITYYLQKSQKTQAEETPKPQTSGLDFLDTGMAALINGDYTTAKADLRSAVDMFKTSNDQRLVVVGLTFQAVTEAADQEFEAAKNSLLIAESEREQLPEDLLQISGWLREIHGLTRDVLALGVPNPEAFVAEVREIAERAARKPW